MSLRLEGDRVSRAALENIWSQAKRLIADGTKAAPALGIAETFPMVELPLAEAKELASPLPFRGRWLHLVSDGRQRPMYALSQPVGPAAKDWVLLGLVRSTLANRIHRAFQRAAKQISGRYVVRVLRVPECRLTALLLDPGRRDAESLVLVVSAPTDRSSGIRRTLQPYSEFLAALDGVAEVASFARRTAGTRGSRSKASTRGPGKPLIPSHVRTRHR